MPRKTIFMILTLLLSILPIFDNLITVRAADKYQHLTTQESEIIAHVNGTNAYGYDLELERIALDRNISGYTFRSSGSPGAEEAASWIKMQFENIGLETQLESFEFTNWTLLSQPTLIVDCDGNASTTGDQRTIRSFQAAHYSWPTSGNESFREIVTLPLPEATNPEGVAAGRYDSQAWNATNTTGRILLMGRPFSTRLRSVFLNKLASEPPAAIVFTWWYDWMSFTPPLFGSIGGRPASASGPYYWTMDIPTGWISFEDGMWIRNQWANASVSACLTIRATIGYGEHQNVVGKLRGSADPEKAIIISAHYDTVMTSGFCDNGAGTAGIIELARVFAEAKESGLYNPKETLLFIAFTGEELGFVGAVNYMKQHRTELNSVVAVINLDCIGVGDLNYSETFPDDKGLDLAAIVKRAAEDLGISIGSEESGGSDQEAFRNPVLTDAMYREYWGSYSGINDTVRVKSSIMLSGYPLFYSDLWQNGVAGWIHTEYDNSTSTATLGWVKTDTLERHLRVAALSVMRVMSRPYDSFFLQLTVFSGVAGIAIAIAVYFWHSKVKRALTRAYDSIISYMEMKEIVCAVGLTTILLFSSFAGYTSVRRVEIAIKGFPTAVTMQYFGYPFEMVNVPFVTEPPREGEFDLAGLRQVPEIHTSISLEGIVLNTALFFLLAFGLTYVVKRLYEAYIARKKLTF
jgi:hypothetical protein